MQKTPYPSKFAKFIEILEVENSRLKFYNLAENLNDITKQDIDNAKEVIQKNSEIFKDHKDLGFVLNHRCGDKYLLLVCSFRNENEIWETVYYNGSGMFEIWERKPPHLPTFCVWEMGVVYHESKAYKEFLGTDMAEEDIQNYLNNIFEGEV